MNDVTPPGRLPSPKVPQRPLKGVRPLAPPPRVIAPPDTPSTPSDSQTALELPIAVEPAHVAVERPKRRWLKWLLITLTTLVLLAAAAGTAGYFWYKDALTPRSSSEDRIKIEVTAGAAAGDVATDLEQKGLIKSALALQIYMKLHGKSSIKAGAYVFTPNQTPQEIVEWLVEGRVDTFKLTILPGKSLVEIKKALQEYGYTAADIDAAFKATYDHPLLEGKPAGTSLEGYIYPETYFVSSQTPLKEVITTAFDHFEARIKDSSVKQQLAQHGLNLYQGITLASMIEKEVSKAQDKRQVAQVFLKRLGEGARLASDPTYKYAAALLGIPPTNEIDSPYNTYKHAGLPPGPIANFTFDSLEAAGNPASGDYLYFVAGDDGTTHFSRTFEEHEQNIQLYCKKLCSTF